MYAVLDITGQPQIYIQIKEARNIADQYDT
jgi:hypothetical protein